MKKKIVAMSLLSIIMCASLIVGATFALFTSKSDINIAITSGNVEVVATIDSSTAKSKQLGTDYQDGLDGTYAKAVSIDEETGAIMLAKFVAGDGVKFDIRIENKSDVDVKYRTNVSFEGDETFFNALDITFDGGASQWTKLEVDSEDQIVHVTIELPEVFGGITNAQTTKLMFLVEAVQGNADTSGAVTVAEKSKFTSAEGFESKTLEMMDAGVTFTTAEYKGGTALVAEGTISTSDVITNALTGLEDAYTVFVGFRVQNPNALLYTKAYVSDTEVPLEDATGDYVDVYNMLYGNGDGNWNNKEKVRTMEIVWSDANKKNTFQQIIAFDATRVEVVPNVTLNGVGYDSVSAAIEAAKDNDMIEIYESVVAEQIVVSGKKITIRAAEGRQPVIIGPSDYTTMMSVAKAEINESRDVYSIVLATNGANLTLENVTVQGKLDFTSGELSLINQTGSMRYSGVASCNASLTLNGVEVYDIFNPNYFGYQNICSVYAVGQGVVELDGCVIERFQKGGIVVRSSVTSFTLKNSTVLGVGPTDKTAQNAVQIECDAVITGNVLGNVAYIPESAGAVALLTVDMLRNGKTLNGFTFHVGDNSLLETDLLSKNNFIDSEKNIGYTTFYSMPVAQNMTTGAVYYNTIQEAINAATNGAVIEIANGTFYEALVVENKNITIKGALESVLTFDQNTSFEVFDAVAGETTNYQGIVVAKNATLTLENITVRGNMEAGYQKLAANRYAGVYAIDSDVTMNNCFVKDICFTENYFGVQNGNAIYAVSSDSKTLTLNEVVVENFQKTGILTRANVTLNMNGGTIQGIGKTTLTAQNGIQYSGPATIKNVTISDIWYDGNASAIGLFAYPINNATSTIDRVVVKNCQYDMTVYSAGTVTITNSEITSIASIAEGATVRIDGEIVTLN